MTLLQKLITNLLSFQEKTFAVICIKAMCKDSGRKTNTKEETWSRGTYAQRRNQQTATHSYSRPNIPDPPTNTLNLLRQYSKPKEQYSL